MTSCIPLASYEAIELLILLPLVITLVHKAISSTCITCILSCGLRIQMGWSHLLQDKRQQSCCQVLERKYLFTLWSPRTIISDNGTHFCNRTYEALMRKYVITHKLSTPYHPQTSGQVKVSNRQVKLILKKTVNQNRKDWSTKLVDAIWAYRTTFKMILGISPYRLVFEKVATFLSS